MDEVLVAVDGSDPSMFRGLQVGHELHEQAQVPLGLISVVADWTEEKERRRVIRHRLPLGEAGSPLIGSSGIKVDVAEDPRSYLINTIREQDQALFCMATHGRGAVTEAVLGSVAASVVRHVHRPVILAGPGLPNDWRGPVMRVVVPLDGSELSEAMLPYAVDLAEELDGELRLLRIADTEGGVGSDHTAGSAEAYLEALGEQLQPRMSRPLTWTVLEDREPARAIVDYCSGRGSLVMMSTLGWSGLARLALGSVAQEVVRRAPFPVGVMCPPTS
ncbi:MAG: universal stress protein, partial [Halorhodospira sp.]